jgi:UDPglucose 6-dehydrogenase
MKIAVVGLWHLGLTTAACLANAGHDVLAYDPDAATINKLQQGQAPIFEPGLEDLLARGKSLGTLHYSNDPHNLSTAEIVWITFDTPVDDNDIADIHSVIKTITTLFPRLQNNVLVLISSQLPVGTTRQLQQLCRSQYPEKNITFGCSPENLRLGKAISVFTKPDRIIVGLETAADKSRVQTLLKPFTENIIWMSIESAEMTKHALNAFLATSVVFVNELSALCEQVGANAHEVAQGLKSEERIGQKAYLRPGNAIAGGTLARDVNYLIQIGQLQKIDTPLFSALLTSNHAHKQWSCRRIMEVLKDLKDKTITILGLTYKAGTDTLRRSTAIETCQWLSRQGAKILAYDPAITELPPHLTAFIHLKSTLAEALQNADAVMIATECPEFNTLSVDELLASTKQPYLFDPNGFLASIFADDARVGYFSVGRKS